MRSTSTNAPYEAAPQAAPGRDERVDPLAYEAEAFASAKKKTPVPGLLPARS